MLQQSFQNLLEISVYFESLQKSIDLFLSTKSQIDRVLKCPEQQLDTKIKLEKLVWVLKTLGNPFQSIFLLLALLWHRLMNNINFFGLKISFLILIKTQIIFGTCLRHTLYKFETFFV